MTNSLGISKRDRFVFAVGTVFLCIGLWEENNCITNGLMKF